MKIKITRPDGTVIEAEGTADECERLAAKPCDAVSPWPHVPTAPYYVPIPYATTPWQPWIGPTVTWTTPTTGGLALTTTTAEVAS